MSLKVICTTCNGEGSIHTLIRKKRCPDCDGEGRITTYSTNMLQKVMDDEVQDFLY